MKKTFLKNRVWIGAVSVALVSLLIAATQPLNILVDSSGNVLWPATLFTQNSASSDWKAAITASPTPSATTNLVVASTNGALITATNFTIDATNKALITATNFTISATNNALITATNFTIDATNKALVTATNFTIDATNKALITATNFSISATNSLAAGIRNVVYTNLVDYNFTIPAGLNRDAQKDTLAFARIVRSYGGPDITTNRVASRIAAGLSHIYNTCGASSVVDAWFFCSEMNVSTGTNVPTMRGVKGGVYNATYNESGMWFNGVDTHGRWNTFPSNQTNTIAIRYASETNIMSSLQWLYSLQNPSGYVSGMHSSMGYQSSAFYPWVYNSTLVAGRAIFGTYYNGGPAEGAYKGMRQFRNVILTHDGVNSVYEYVNGLYSTNTTLTASTAQCTEMLVGRRSDNQYYFRGGLQIILYFNRALTPTEAVEVDWAMSLIADERPISIWGDSISYFDLADGLQGREWPQQLWASLGYWTNKVVVHNFSISGIQAVTQLGNLPRTVNRRPTLAARDSHAFVLLGFNDINGGASATTTYGRVSNIWYNLRTNGYTVHALTLLPISQSSPSYTLTKANYINDFNSYLLDQHLNAQIRPFDYYWNINQLVTDNVGGTELFDGIHPTNSVHAAIGQFIASSNSIWLR